MEFVIGIIVGAILYYAFVDHKKSSGTFVINLSDPEEETCRLIWDESLNELCSKKKVVLDVKTIWNDSQK